MENDRNDQPPPGMPVDELLLLATYRKLDPDLKDDARRFLGACLRQQGGRREIPSNIVNFPKKSA